MFLTLLQIALNENILLYNFLFQPIILFSEFKHSWLIESELLGDGGLSVLMSVNLLGEFGDKSAFLIGNLKTVLFEGYELFAHGCVWLPEWEIIIGMYLF